MEDFTRVCDLDAIRRAAIRYCRGIDRLDAELVRSAYWPEATDDHGTFVGLAHEFASYAVDRLRSAFVATMHTIFNHSIEFEPDGGHAAGEVYAVCYHLRDADGARELYTWWGRYLDRYEKRSDDWRIIDRVCVHEWTKAEELNRTMPIPWEVFRQGSLDRGVSAG